jgi:hypothetical protein
MTLTLPKHSVPLPPDHFPFKSRVLQDHIEFQATDPNAILKVLLDAQTDLTHMTMRVPNLEDVFLVLTGRKLRD